MKKYYDRQSTPLLWHGFTRFFRIPVGIIFSLLSIPDAFTSTIGFPVLNWLTPLFSISELALSLIIFIGFLKWKSYAWISYYIQYSLTVLFHLISFFWSLIYTPSAIGVSLGYLIATCILFLLEGIYYYKRKALFCSNPQKQRIGVIDNDFPDETNKESEAESETKDLQNKSIHFDKEENIMERSFISYKCTHCGIVYMANYYPVIYQGNPQIDEKVKNGTIFETRCPNCGNIATLIYPCIYIDESREYAVTLQQVYEDGDKETIRKGFPDDYIITFTTDTISFVGTVNVLSSKPIVSQASETQNENTKTPSVQAPEKNEISTKRKKLFAGILSVSIALVILAVMINITSKDPMYNNSSSNNSGTTSAGIDGSDADTNYIAQEYPASGTILYENGESRICPLSIETESVDTDAYYIKLVNSQGHTVLTTFIHPGSKIEINVPTGTYRLRYASGKTWYGETNLFGPETHYSEATSPFYFYSDASGTHGYTVELYKQFDGNLGEKTLDKSEF